MPQEEGRVLKLDLRKSDPGAVAQELYLRITRMERHMARAEVLHGADGRVRFAVAGVLSASEALGYFDRMGLGIDQAAQDPELSWVRPRKATVCGRPGAGGSRAPSRAQDLGGQVPFLDAGGRPAAAAITLSVERVYSARQRGALGLVVKCGGPDEVLALRAAMEVFRRENLVADFADGLGWRNSGKPEFKRGLEPELAEAVEKASEDEAGLYLLILLE